jgi:hypothetical protein
MIDIPAMIKRLRAAAEISMSPIWTDAADALESQAFEIKELKRKEENLIEANKELIENTELDHYRIQSLQLSLKYQENREGRIGTHGPGCWSWGPFQHYECALRRIDELQELSNPG